jgi:tetratricopeptide (TPR) repeat protein
MTLSSLHWPDHPIWRSDSHYSDAAAHGLITAYAHITGADTRPDNFISAYLCVAPFKNARVSVHQRMHILYVLSKAYASDGSYAEAHRSLSEAIESALQLHDDGALTELFSLRGAACQGMDAYAEALDDTRMSLAFLRNHSERAANHNRALELAPLVRMAAYAYMLMLFEASEQMLREAEELARQAPAAGMQALGIFDWVQALHARTRGELDRALHCAMRAADAFHIGTNLSSSSRVQTHVAETALDMAALFPSNSLSDARTAYLKLAGDYMRRGLSIARQGHDVTGACFARLTKCRYAWLTQPGERTLAKIGDVARQALKLGDMGLLGQAQTALGEAHRALGNREVALKWYGQALETLRVTQMPVLGLSAFRAIHRANDMGHGLGD